MNITRRIACRVSVALLVGAVFAFAACQSEWKQAMNYEKQGQWQEAQKLLEELVKKNPQDPKLHNELGYVYQKRGYYDMAFNQYEKAIKLDPYYVEAIYNRGTLQYKRRQISKASKDFEKVISLDENFAKAHNNLGLLNHMFFHKPEKAMEHYKKAIELEPENPVYHENLGQLYKDMGRTAEAKQELKRAEALKAARVGGK